MPSRTRKNTWLRQFTWFGIPAVAAALFGFWLYGPMIRAPGEGPHSRSLVTSRESLYNNIYVYSHGPYLSMTFGYNRKIYTESMYNTQDESELPVTYTRYMTAPLMYAKDVASILEIGFGGGRTAWYLHRFLPDVPVTSVELDPAVVEISRQYFGIRDEPKFNVVTRDGRSYLADTKNRYDIILVDAYRGPFVPFHLLTKEFYEIVKAHLNEGGVVAQNVEPTTMLFDSAVATIRSVFPNTDFYVSNGNVVMIAYDGAPRSKDELSHMAAGRQQEFGLRYTLPAMLAERKVFVPGMIDGAAKILTDDFAPVEMLKAIETHNRKWIDQ
ncbi:MAG: spermidine synthase [Bdellovibrionales bacterium]